MAEFPLDGTEVRANFAYFLTIQTRWNDLDSYRHMNNAQYYAYFDSTIMAYLIGERGIDLLDGPCVPFTVENMCRFHRELRFPAVAECGLRVARIGNSSVRYDIGLFAKDRDAVAATAYFVDVYVDRDSHKPTRIPGPVRDALTALIVN